MLQQAHQDKTDALAAARQASRDLAEAIRLRNQFRRSSRQPATAPRNSAPDSVLLPPDQVPKP
jgi:hypothetical protein